MRARHPTKLNRTLQAGENGELGDINFVGTSGFGVGDVGEPLQLSRHFGELTELDRGECALIIRRVGVV